MIFLPHSQINLWGRKIKVTCTLTSVQNEIQLIVNGAEILDTERARFPADVGAGQCQRFPQLVHERGQKVILNDPDADRGDPGVQLWVQEVFAGQHGCDRARQQLLQYSASHFQEY